jgi:ketosteroid isomerase-like protein
MELNQEAVAVVRSLYAALNQKDIEALKNCLDEQVDFVDMYLSSVIRGRESVGRYFQNWLDAFPDGKGEIINLISTDDQVVIEVIGRGTFEKLLPGWKVQLTRTGEQSIIRFCQIFRVKSGKILSVHSYYDLAGVLRSEAVARAA